MITKQYSIALYIGSNCFCHPESSVGFYDTISTIFFSINGELNLPVLSITKKAAQWFEIWLILGFIQRINVRF